MATLKPDIGYSIRFEDGTLKITKMALTTEKIKTMYKTLKHENKFHARQSTVSFRAMVEPDILNSEVPKHEQSQNMANRRNQRREEYGRRTRPWRNVQGRNIAPAQTVAYCHWQGPMCRHVVLDFVQGKERWSCSIGELGCFPVLFIID
ncbi:Uncharacterized protein Fot_42781 [Forsythia ovata]|uniref:Uncharacterized protein n=1 Tax=Forsythia ovata TaxID=205694 RepID=A0ABD1RR17_9LAMI